MITNWRRGGHPAGKPLPPDLDRRRPLPGDYQTFVHLRDPANGQNVAQADGPPLAGWYPTSWWPAGEAVTDWRNFPLPADLPPGRYRLVVGFYDLAGQQRVGQEFDLGLVEVQP